MSNFFKKKGCFIRATLPVLLIKTAVIVLIFILTGLISMSCTGNFKNKESHITAGTAGSAAVPPGEGPIGGNSGEANNSENVCCKESDGIEIDEAENPSGGNNVYGSGDICKDEGLEEKTGESEAEEEQEKYGEINEESSEEAAVNDTGVIDFNDAESFRVDVNLSKQVVYVFYKEELIKEMICSGGTGEKPTPMGEFKTTEKGEDFWSYKYNMGAYYWIRFYNEYLFHSIPFDSERQIIAEESEKLGTPASHGRIRLGLEDAGWMYDMLPLRVKVLIYR